MKNNVFSSIIICRAGLIAALYSLLTISLPFISYGSFQIRISEALCILPLFFPESIIGLTLGCFISNFFGNGVLDIIFGTLSTFFASLFTYFIGKKLLNSYLKYLIGSFFPVIINAIVIPFTILIYTELKSLYWITFLQILIGEFLSIYILGGFVYFYLIKHQKKNL